MQAPDPAAIAAGADPALLMQQMMADAAAADPKMAMLAQMLAGSRAAAAPQPDDDNDDEIAELNARLERADARIIAMKRDGRRLLEAYQACRERLGLLAAALGACGLCWGDNESCPSCRGRGRPGMVRPDPELRARLLGPPRKPDPKAEQTDHHIC
jgi:hypothetical protein